MKSACAILMLVVSSCALALLGCDESNEKAAVPRARLDAASEAPPPPPPEEGCARTGPLDAVEADPACLLVRAREDVMTYTRRHLALDLKTDLPSTTPGGTIVLRLGLTNTSDHEVLVVLDGQAPSGVDHPDWGRLAGGPDLRPRAPDTPRLLFAISTIDARDHVVDGLGTVAATTAPTKLLGVRLRAGGKLTHTFSWWALRIPAPAPIFRDDAGHVIVPKTMPIPLDPGEYGVRVAVPFHGLLPAEGTATARIRVEPRSKE